MRYLQHHIKAIFAAYTGDVPLAHFLKGYYRQQPRLGSRDRRMLTTLAYSWYRCGRGIPGSDQFLHLASQWQEQPGTYADFSIREWLKNEFPGFDAGTLFPYDFPLSNGISKEEWLLSMLTQPDLFIRVRKNKQRITGLLHEHNLPYRLVIENCIALANGAGIDRVLPDEDYVVQDASSQKTGDFFMPVKGEEWYDCCAGAGGKSLLLKDREPDIRLTASDRRESILHNLKQRFKTYHHAIPETIVADVADKNALHRSLAGKKFDHIICDAPCSGSGTWARTPEQLYFASPEAINRFPELQRQIAINVVDYLKPGGTLIYITCSVFKSENEDVSGQVAAQCQLTPLQSLLINGIHERADSMYVAVLRK